MAARQEEKTRAASCSFPLLRLTDYKPFMPGFSLVPCLLISAV